MTINRKDIGCFVMTVSDTRTVETDKSGQLIKEYLIEQSYVIIDHLIVKDKKEAISSVLDEILEDNRVTIILMTGGTGIAKRDVTIEVVEDRLVKKLPGFGEIFRLISYTDDIGSAAIMSRAVAGVAQDKAIFAMPGSSGAVKLAMEKLIIPEIEHIASELRK